MFKTYISEMAGFQFAGAELDMTESTVGDAFVGILHVFLFPMGYIHSQYPRKFPHRAILCWGK